MMAEKNKQKMSGQVQWSCPSNIALIKYWGKKEVQIPKNPSLSMTLQEARSITRLRYFYDPAQKGVKVQFRFEGKQAPSFEDRIVAFIKHCEPQIPVLRHCYMEIDSKNTFPHSSGIASSASAMGALALCLVQLEGKIMGQQDPENFWRKTSSIARLGSGSASRSLYPRFSLWGRSGLWEGSSDEYAIPIHNFHPAFRNLRDSILIVESGQKKISSSAGHSLMDTHPFAEARFSQAHENLGLLQSALQEGNWNLFISVVEQEALSLHAMMLTSKPGYILMQPGTLSILNKIRNFREESGFRLCFTLDAGANVHLLYAEGDAGPVEAFIETDLYAHCENNQVIRDRMGQGPYKTEEG